MFCTLQTIMTIDLLISTYLQDGLLSAKSKQICITGHMSKFNNLRNIYSFFKLRMFNDIFDGALLTKNVTLVSLVRVFKYILNSYGNKTIDQTIVFQIQHTV